MHINLLQVSGGTYLIRNNTALYSDVSLTYNGPNARVSFELTKDRFPVPRNSVIKYGFFANLELFYTKRNPSTTLLTGNSNVTSCGGQCISNRCDNCGNGIVDVGEACDGGDCCNSTCQFRSSTFVCRAATGTCDVAETCTGSSALCPSDVNSCTTSTAAASTGAASSASTAASSAPSSATSITQESNSNPTQLVSLLWLVVLSAAILF